MGNNQHADQKLQAKIEYQFELFDREGRRIDG